MCTTRVVDKSKREVLSKKEFGKAIRKVSNRNIVFKDKIIFIDPKPGEIRFTDELVLEGLYYLSIIFRNCEVHIDNAISICGSYINTSFMDCDVYRNIKNPENFYFFNGLYDNCRIHFNYYNKRRDFFNGNCIFDNPPPLACPSEGEFFGYKVVREILKDIGEDGWEYSKYCKYRILKLLIPADAKRSSAFGKKCRCSKAMPVELYDLNGNVIESSNRIESCSGAIYLGKQFNYYIGRMAYPDTWDDNRFNECSKGIHFFMTFEEAVDYYNGKDF